VKSFISAQIKGVKRTPGVRMPKPAGCMIVKRLAAHSPAAELGLAPKDFLVSLDGKEAAGLVPQTYLYEAEEHRWAFYSRPRHELIELLATGIEPGVEVERTLDAVKARYDPAKSSPKDLEAVWEGRDWAALEALSLATLSARGRDRDTPALAFLGAAQWETGRKAEGLALVREYVERYISSWTLNFAGIALSYLAQDLLSRGERDKGLAVLQKAFESHGCSRLADLVQKHTGERPPLETDRWRSLPFPIDYELPRIGEGEARVSLGQALGALRDGQLLAVCLLDGYRGNGPYNAFMARYKHYARWFGGYLAGLHVVTMEPERREDRAHYFVAEDEVRAARLPLELLLEDGAVSDAVQQTSSPFIVLLDRARRVRYEGELESVDLWDALWAVQPGG
jgi:hypothetical protein